MKPIKKVFIFGGTHGNEWTGVKVVQNYAEHLKGKYPNLDLEFILANPEAYKLNKRFKDEDLNRAFQFLGEDRKNSFENQRAHEIRDLILKEECFVIDLHTTTSNMGKTVILSDYDPINIKICMHLRDNIADCKIIGSLDPDRKYLGSQTKFGLMIEVGPTPNGLIHPNALEDTLMLLEGLLDGISSVQNISKGSLEIYEEVENIFYPLTPQGEISSYIHSSFQGRDFCVLKGDYLAFKDFSGKEITLHSEAEVYPIFINEAAYYPQHLAFTLCEKRKLSL